MVSSAEHGILNAHKYKYIKKITFFSNPDKRIMLFFMLLNVKLPTIVGILIFMSRKNIMFNRVENDFL